jgi:hypothetical protein
MSGRGTERPTTALPPGFIRIPGLFRRAELEPIDKLEPGFHVVTAGAAPDGTELVTRIPARSRRTSQRSA